VRVKGILVPAFLAATVAALLAPAARGEEWTFVGGASRGMGGSGVALDRSPYWNPATLSKFPSGEDAFDIANLIDEVDFSVLAGLEVSAQGDVIAEADDIIDLWDEKDYEQVQQRLDDGSASTTDIEYALVLIKEVNDLNRRGEGIYATSGAEAYLRIGKNIGVTVGNFAWSGADPNFDLSIFSAFSAGGFSTLFSTTGSGTPPSSADGWLLVNELKAEGIDDADARELAFLSEEAGIDLSQPDVRQGIVLAAVNTETGGAGTLYDNHSGFTLSGVVVQEFGINLSLPLFNERLSIGATAKLLHGITYKRDYYLKDIDSGEDLLNDTYQDFRENREESNKFGLDVGVRARPIPWVTLGAVAKNLTSPTFRLIGKGSYKVRPQVRLGAAFHPMDLLTFAIDFDLFRTDSEALDGYYSQLLGAGVAFKPVDSQLFGFALRAGAYRNLAMAAEETVYTAGFSMRIWAFELEFAGASSLYLKSMADVEKETMGDPSDPNPPRQVDLELPERLGLSVTFRFLLTF